VPKKETGWRIRMYLSIVRNIVILMLLSSASSGQMYYVVKLDVVGLPSDLRVIRPSIETTITHNITALLYYENGKYATGTTQQGTSGTPHEVYKLTGWGLMPELRYYIFSKNNKAPYGFFAEAFFRFRKVEEKYDGEDKTTYNGSSSQKKIHILTYGTAYNDGVDIGYKWARGNLIAELLAGYGVAWGKWEEENDRNQIPEFYKVNLSDATNALRYEISIGLIFPTYKYR
jgi:hypothetical protein